MANGERIGYGRAGGGVAVTDGEEAAGVGGGAGMEPQEPPTTIPGILRKLGPGLILAGSIVGSGELIATTAAGAEAGFVLLWLIILGCVIKVFTQIELAKYAISSGETTLKALNAIPPVASVQVGRRSLRANFIVLFWLAMFLTGLAQLGGIVGGVGQAMSISVPLTAEGREYNETVGEKVQLEAKIAELEEAEEDGEVTNLEEIREAAQEAIDEVAALPATTDDKWWAAIIGVVTIVLLVRGGFRFIETFCTVLVGAFTLITIVNLIALQSHDAWAVSWAEIRSGLSFQLPMTEAGMSGAALGTALAAFGIIGVGAAELVGYPYWCLEKGYGAWIGPREEGEAWLRRARGWLRVLKWDAWCSMVIYTFSTVAFYLLGAAILGRTGLRAEGTEMVRTLAVMYEPVFGRGAQLIFLVGAFAVLFSTFFVANAQKARLMTDVGDVFGFVKLTPATRRLGIKFFSVVFPALCVLIYVLIPKPGVLVKVSGVMQALLLPLLGIAALYYRYRRTDKRLRGGKVWDAMLWLSFICFAVVGIYLAGNKLGAW
ncbi:MAG: divalent metal cation transporter [Verrucomicrobiota bacterium]